MLTFYLKLLLYTLGVLLTERRFGITNAVYTIEAPEPRMVHTISCNRVRHFVTTVFRDPPPLPNPVVVVVGPTFASCFAADNSNGNDNSTSIAASTTISTINNANSKGNCNANTGNSNGNGNSHANAVGKGTCSDTETLPKDDAGRQAYEQHYTLKSSRPESGAPAEFAHEELKEHPEYHAEMYIDASEGQHDAQQYLARHRKPSLRQEVHALVVYSPRPRPPPFIINWALVFDVLAFSTAVAVVSYYLLQYKHYQLLYRYDTERESLIPKHCRCWATYFRTGAPAHWIEVYRGMQARYDGKIKGLKARNKRLQRRLVSKFLKNTRLRFRSYELRACNDSLVRMAKELVQKYRAMEKDVADVKMRFRLAMLFADPEQAMVDRAIREANEGHEAYMKSLAKRGPMDDEKEIDRRIQKRMSGTAHGRRWLRIHIPRLAVVDARDPVRPARLEGETTREYKNRVFK